MSLTPHSAVPYRQAGTEALVHRIDRAHRQLAAGVKTCVAQSACQIVFAQAWRSTNQPNPRTRYLPKRRCFDAAQQPFVGLPGAASGHKASGRIDDGSPLTVSRRCAVERVVDPGELLSNVALDIKQAFGIDVEKWRRSSAPCATVFHPPPPRRCWPGERAVRQSREHGQRLPVGAFA